METTISQAQLNKLIKVVGEKELIKIIPEAFVPKYNESKIYIYKHYKLHRIEGNIFAFIDMRSSNCSANGSGSFESQINYVGDELKVFDSYEDYIKWAYNKLKEC